MTARTAISTMFLGLGTALAASASAAPVIGVPVVVATTGNVIATYLGSDARYRDRLGLVGGASMIFDNKVTAAGTTVNLGSFTAGTELVFSLSVVNTGLTFFSGPASANGDGVAHAALTEQAGLPLLVGFEDMRGGGDRDYNDVLFSLSNAVPAPEPLTWTMLIVGFGLAGTIMRRQHAWARRA